MIDRKILLNDCKGLVKYLEDDIRERAKSDAELESQLQEQHTQLLEGKKTATTFSVWLDENVTQASVAWVLSSVFVRFMEDNGLIDHAWISGPVHEDSKNDRLQLAKAQREAYFSKNPVDSDVQYLQFVFRELGSIPACKSLFDEKLNPLWQLPVSAEGAGRMLEFWQELDGESGTLVREMMNEDVSDTRFLGDLYQDLSEAARKRYALLQTPDFVEEFILDYTLTPAMETFGLEGLRMIDPTCGSGHFLLGGFKRILAAWEEEGDVSMTLQQMVGKALESVYGIDLNPFAVAISRFRLMVAALVACERKRLLDLPSFKLNLAVGDALLGGKRFSGDLTLQDLDGMNWCDNWLVPGEAMEANRILSQQYHAVVGNPPYIAVKDKGVRDEIKKRYSSCHKKWTLSVPFIQRFFDIGLSGAGYVGLINSNNFTKREFGKKLIESFFKEVELSHIVDTQGAFIPGHETPTIILLGLNKQPNREKLVKAVQNINSEATKPTEPAKGLVWKSIIELIDQTNVKDKWMSVDSINRDKFNEHPWCLGGGDIPGLIESIKENHEVCKNLGFEFGFMGFSAADEILIRKRQDYSRLKFEDCLIKNLVVGENVRDWVTSDLNAIFFPYVGKKLIQIMEYPKSEMNLFYYRSSMLGRPTFGGKTYLSENLPWYKWHQVTTSRTEMSYIISFAFVGTHNHFFLSRSPVVFKQTAPVITSSLDLNEGKYLELLSCLNSSTAAFWFRQVMMPKNINAGEPWECRLEHDCTKVGTTPITQEFQTERLELTKSIDDLSQQILAFQPITLFDKNTPSAKLLEEANQKQHSINQSMIFLQEELDWLVYQAYGILTPEETPLHNPDNIIPLELGQRAFEIDLARKLQSGEEQTSWFTRHRSTPITDIPSDWPDSYKSVVQRRLDLIANHPHIALLEKPEHKRRWAREPWEDTVKKGLYEWLCDRLETEPIRGSEPEFLSTNELSDRAFSDPEFKQVADLYRGNDTYEQSTLVAELISTECVPYLPTMRYTDSGLRKREDWQSTWERQRTEDQFTSWLISILIEAYEEFKLQQPENESTGSSELENFLQPKTEIEEALENGDDPLAAFFLETQNLLTISDIYFGYKNRKVEDIVKTIEAKTNDTRPKPYPGFEDLNWDKVKGNDNLYQSFLDTHKKISDIPVPPRYASKDFIGSTYWKHRGKLDVPKERFISYPLAEKDGDTSLVVLWAGFNHLEQAQALANYIAWAREEQGWSSERLIPLLAGLDELLPWIKQWHNEYSADFGGLPSDVYEGFLSEELRYAEVSRDDLKSWQPPAAPKKTRSKKKKANT